MTRKASAISSSSATIGFETMRRAIIEADLVDCMIALPGQLFYSTETSASFQKAA